MSQPPVRFHIPYQTGRERGYLDEVFGSGQFAGNGPFTKRCQTSLCQLTGAPHALLTHSCTGALELAAMLADLGPGDEVLMPSFTFVSTATAVLRTGATPVFCEVDPLTMTLCPKDAAQRVTPRTRAIVPVHYGGIGADMPAILALAKEHNLLVWEDAAQGLGASRFGRPLGSWAPLACLSFHETKNVHSGLGGALLINDASRFARAEIMWERGTNRSQFFKGLVDKYSWVEPGSSFYPSELTAAFLLAQLEGLQADTDARRPLWHAYDAALQPLVAAGQIEVMHTPADATSNYHNYWLRLPTADLTDRVRERCNQQGVQVVIHYVPLHTAKMGAKLGYALGDLPVTEDTAARLLRLPMHHTLTLAEVERVVATLTTALAAG
jgi:dTDP-4-amino-4,6-dideoxygalactose transaminase